MPQPTSSQVHVDKPLTNISIAFIQRAEMFVAAQVFPVVPVSKQSDLYFTYDRRDWKRIIAEERAPSSESAGGGFKLATDSYSARVVAVHKDVDEQIRANADDPVDLDRDATEWVTTQMLLKRENDWAAKFFQTSVWTGDQTGVAAAPGANEFLQWNDAASTPIEDVTNQGIEIAQLTGFRPNVAVASPSVFNALKNHPDILDRIKFTERGIVTTELLRALFEVEKFVVAWAVKDTSVEGSATEVSEFILDDALLLAYAAPTPSILMPSAGYNFAWNGLLGAGAYGTRITRMDVPLKKAERIEGELAYDQKVVSPDLATFFTSAVA